MRLNVNLPARGYRIVWRLVLLGAIGAMLGACSGEQAGDDQDGGQPSETTSGSVPEGPGVQVSADKTHAVQPGDEITVSIAVDKFTLDAAKIGEPHEPGVGHYRIYLDDASDDDFLADGAEETVKVRIPDDITDGSHQLRVVLHNNDGSPVSPAAEGEVWLIVYRL